MPKINFYGDVRAELELEKVIQEGSAGLKITVPISFYQAMPSIGWQSYDLPANIVMPNSCVVLEKDLPKLLDVLQYFIDTYSLPDESLKTKRGFGYLDLNELSLQESSSDNALWFGFSIEIKDMSLSFGNGERKPFIPEETDSFLLNDRLHLSRANVSVLLQAIESVMQGKELPDLTIHEVQYEDVKNLMQPFSKASFDGVSSFLYFLFKGEDYYSGEKRIYTQIELKSVFNNLLTYIFEQNNANIFFSTKESQTNKAYFEGVLSDNVFELWNKIQVAKGKNIDLIYFVEAFKGFELYDQKDTKSSLKEVFLSKLQEVTEKAPISLCM